MQTTKWKMLAYQMQSSIIWLTYSQPKKIKNYDPLFINDTHPNRRSFCPNLCSQNQLLMAMDTQLMQNWIISSPFRCRTMSQYIGGKWLLQVGCVAAQGVMKWHLTCWLEAREYTSIHMPMLLNWGANDYNLWAPKIWGVNAYTCVIILKKVLY